ncbi:MAG: glycosyltransferase family 39 protein [Candidatus Hydrogenedentota bacterium]
MNAKKQPKKDPKDKPEHAVPWLERSHVGIALLLGLGLFFWLCFALAGTFSAPEERITGVDPVAYYAWMRSLAFDGDLDFENEYRTLVPKEALAEGSPVDPDGARTATGRVPNVFSIGPGLLWAPFVAMGHLAAKMSGLPADGFSQPYHTAVFLANIVYGTLGALLVFGALRAWWGRRISTLAAIGAWACSPALYYTFAQEAMSHACSFFTMALFLCAWLHLRKRETWWGWTLIGAALGLAALVRWQNATFAVIPAIDLLWKTDRRKIGRLAVCAAATVLVFSPQMAGWHVLYGSPVTLPQGQGFMTWLRPAILHVLFSAQEGLFTWTPLMAAGVIGLFLWPKTEKKAYVAMVVAVLIQVYISACAGEAGWSFGMRRLVNCTPFFGIGLATLLSRFMTGKPAWAAFILAACTAWNALFAMQYGGLLDMLYVNEALHVLSEQHNVPVDALTNMEKLPDGTPFNIEEFVQTHRFPRDRAPTFSQFTTDKLTVLIVFVRRLLGMG